MMNNLNVNLNDLYLFVQVVDRKGFTAAADAMQIPKSRVSRRVAGLEQLLGVRLLQRTSRRITLTDVGMAFYARCVAMIAEAHQAEDVVRRTLTEPAGVIRVSAPSGIVDFVLSDLLPKFMMLFPKVEVITKVTNRHVDLIEERMDVALRINPQPLENSSLIQSELCKTPWGLYAGPAFIKKMGRLKNPSDLAAVDALVFGIDTETPKWELLSEGHGQQIVSLKPRMRSDSMQLLKNAAVAGMGVAALPTHFCAGDLENGLLQRVLPDWRPPPRQIRLVYPSRRGVVPGVRVFIDFIKTELPARIAALSALG